MPGQHIELHSVTRITVGYVGKPGQRLFLLQASDAVDTITLKIEKEQASALANTARELLENLETEYPETEAPAPTDPRPSSDELALTEPFEPMFVVGQIGLGYDRNRDMIVLAAQELLLDEALEPSTARFWIDRTQLTALSDHALEVVSQGRPNPRLNGNLKAYLQ